MSNFLAVDTSSRYLAVAAKKGEKTAVTFLSDCAMQHSVRLMDEIDKTLNEVGLSPAECDFFAAVTGPGSFTGIRIGISCVKGFATALGKKTVGVTSFEVLSYNINSCCDYLTAIDAAHGRYYVCGYNKDGKQDIAPCYLSGEEVEAFSRPVYGFENLPLENYTRLDASSLLLKAIEKNGGKSGDICALYVRRSQAEEERAARLNNKK